MGDPVRSTALDLVDAVTGEGRLLSELVPAALRDLDPPARARAQRLATETLRWADRADRVLGPYLRKRPSGRVHNALRLGVWEICADGAAPHGVVSALAGIMRADHRTRAQAGLVNAVLRRVADGGAGVWATLPVPRLPRPLRRRFRDAWGNEAVAAMEAAHAVGAPLDLTPKDGDAGALAAKLGGVALANGSVRLSRPGMVSGLPGFAEGDWWVQDAAATLPVLLAAPKAGERALDLCAAPGGKTLQLAAAGADVTAVDISASRLARLEENLARCGLAARAVVADAAEWTEGGFDVVLVDAPCTATGTIRRHPDLPFAKDLSDIGALLALQGRLLDRALAALAPGGRLIWCTCSLLPEEGEGQVAGALARHPGLTVVPASLPFAEEWQDANGGLRTRPDFWPELGGLDGFYVARLERR